ncbi:MAG: WD40 repeat domain-containing protein [Verrucomicrobia bacterium]|nr:WD40 repeat domain-containing protein [Verrucomicrobiota bacterium]
MNRSLTQLLACCLTLMAQPCGAQSQSLPAPPDIPALIAQLANPKVRLRDEAEAKLRLLPDAAGALENAAANHPSEEARARARKILNSAIRNRWYLAADLANGHLQGYVRAPMRIAVSNDLKYFLTQGQDRACLWDGASLNPLHRFGQPNGSLPGWEGAAPIISITLSPDGKTALTTNDYGIIYATDTATGRLRTSWRCFDMVYDVSAQSNRQAVWGVSYTPDGKNLVAGGREGWIVVRDAGTLKRVIAEKITEEAIEGHYYTPDARWLLVVEDTPSDVDYIHVIDTTTWKVVGKRPIRDLINSLYFLEEGKRFIASGRFGYIAIWEFDPETGSIGSETAWGSYGRGVAGIIVSPDQKSVLVGSAVDGKQMCEYDISTRKILWSNTNTPKISAISPFGSDAFITSDWDHHIRVWRRTPAGAANPPPPLIRTLADRFDPAFSFTLKYEAEPHEARPCLIDAIIHLPSSKLLVTRGHDKIRISSAEDLSLIRSFGPPSRRCQGYLSRATCGAITVTKDERTVIAADDSGGIGFYDIETGKLERGFRTIEPDDAETLSPDDLATWELVLDPEEKILYTTDNQMRLCAWEAATGKLVKATRLPAPGATMRLSPDGSTLLIRTQDAQSDCRQLRVSAKDLRILNLSMDARDASHGLGTFTGDETFYLQPAPDGQLRKYPWSGDRTGSPDVILRLPGTLYQTTFSDDGTFLVCAAGGNAPLSVWSPDGKDLLWMADPASGGLYRAIPLENDRIVTVGLSDNKLRLYLRNPTTGAAPE